MPHVYRLRALTTGDPRSPAPHSRRTRRAALVVAAAASAAISLFGSTTRNAYAATVLWDGGTTGTGTAWLTGTNWNPDLAGTTGPATTDIAQFDVMGTGGTGTGGTVIGINPNNATNNGTANQAIGQILLSGGFNRTINNNSGSTPGVLTLNGVGGTLLANTASLLTLTIQNGAGASTLGVVLGDSGAIDVVNSGATVAINSIVSETGGARGITKTGAGTLALSGLNTFTGGVTVEDGTVSVNTLLNTGVAQSLGTSAATMTIGSATSAATLNYTGAATTTNRNFAAGAMGGTLSHANDITYTGTISGTDGPFYKSGTGTLLLSDTGRADCLSLNILGGTVRLDNAAVNNNDRIGNSTSLALFGGTLQFDGQRDVPTAEVVDQLFIGSNHNVIRTTVAGGSASNASISFAGLSRGTGATLAFDLATGADVNFASATLSNGIIGGWAITGSDFATVDGGTGNVVAHASTVSNDPTLWSSNQNVRMNANGTLGSAGNVNSVQLADNAGAPVTLTLNAQLGLSSGGIIATGVSGHTIDGPGSITSLHNELYVHVPDAAHTLTIATPLADNGAGNVNLITTGPGTTVLDAVNTFNGYVQINSGTLQLGANGTLNGTFAANSVIVNTGGTLALNGLTKTIGALSGSGAVTLGAGSLTVGANNTSTTFGGVIAGTGNVTKVGTGTLALTGVSTFSGVTNIGATDGIGTGGVLLVDADSRFGAAPTVATPGKINLYNGTLRLANGQAVTTVATSGGGAGVVGVLINANRGVTLNAGNGKIDVPEGQYGEIPGIITDGASGTSPLHKIGGGTLDFRTAINTFTGGVIVDGGTLGINRDQNLGAVPAGDVDNPDADAVQLNNGATLKWYSSTAGGTDGLVPSRGITIGAGGAVIDWSHSSGVPNLRSRITSAAGNTLTKRGPNTLLSNIAQAHMNGDLNIHQGRWNMQANGSAGAGTIRLTAGAGTGIANTNIAQLGIGGANLNLTITTAQDIVLAPTAGGTNSFEVNLTNNLILNGNISGAGGLTKGRVATTNGILTLGGNNTYSGDTTILLGVLRLSGGSAIPDGSAVVINNPPSGSLARLEVNDTTETIGGLSNSGAGPNLGSVALGAGTLIVDQNTTGTFSGVISGTGNLSVLGTGLLALTGTNTYSGTTQISGVIEAGTASSLGDASATNGITAGGGTLRATGSWSTPTRNVAIDHDGFRVDTNANDVTLGNVTGGGTLRKLGGGTLTVNHVRTPLLDVQAGKVVIAPDTTAAGVSNVGDLLIAPGASLDLKRNKLVTNAPVGSFIGTAYTGVQGEVARAYNFGAWDQPGLTTSEPNAGQNAGILSGTETIAVATAEQVMFIGATDTGVFQGQTVTGASTIAMYTYAGDLNLDGLVDGADYGVIDNSVQFPGTSGYANGDFNYDGVIDGADYGIIDNTVQLQGAPFPGVVFGAASSSGASLSGVTAVPEPSACGFAILSAAALLGRRRRHRTGR